MEVAQRVLEAPQMAGLELFLLRAHARRKFLEVRLDQVCAHLSRAKSFGKDESLVREWESGKPVVVVA